MHKKRGSQNTGFTRDGTATNYTYDANSNRLTAIDKVISDTDLNGEFDDTDFAKATAQSLKVDPSSNKLLGFNQTVTTTNKGEIKSMAVTAVAYSLDANGAMTSDGLRTFVYDAAGRLSKVEAINNGEAASAQFLTNALGQRVFKSEPRVEQTLPNQDTLDQGFIDWLKKSFQWLFASAQSNASIGTLFIYDEDGNLLGEYDNGSASGKGRTEYIWLPSEAGPPIPIGFYRNGKFLPSTPITSAPVVPHAFARSRHGLGLLTLDKPRASGDTPHLFNPRHRLLRCPTTRRRFSGNATATSLSATAIAGGT